MFSTISSSNFNLTKKGLQVAPCAVAKLALGTRLANGEARHFSRKTRRFRIIFAIFLWGSPLSHKVRHFLTNLTSLQYSLINFVPLEKQS